MFRYYTGSIIVTLVCLALAAFWGFETGGTPGAALAAVWICFVLSVLEVSLSFDNAVVNAAVLRNMEPIWRQRFLTWGMLFAVFGMRLVFPLVIVAVAASVSPWAAVSLALEDPEQYRRIIEGANTGIMGFGGAFLLLVGLKFFFDSDKEHHWIEAIEKQLVRVADLEAFEIILTLGILYAVSTRLGTDEALTFLVAGLFGVAAFFAVEWLGHVLEAPAAAGEVARSGLGGFLYLNLLDASFSFDGVIGAFALSSDLVIIALGLGIGAMFVRSMTIYLVDKGTLSQYLYLEHGAFWAIIVLALIMLMSPVAHIPETVTGLIGAGLIVLALISSVRHNRREAGRESAA
jgi:hypothetical protein